MKEVFADWHGRKISAENRGFCIDREEILTDYQSKIPGKFLKTGSVGARYAVGAVVPT